MPITVQDGEPSNSDSLLIDSTGNTRSYRRSIDWPMSFNDTSIQMGPWACLLVMQLFVVMLGAPILSATGKEK